MWRQRVSSLYLNGSLPYVRRHLTVNKNVLSASLNKTLTSLRGWVLVLVRAWLKVRESEREKKKESERKRKRQRERQ